MATGSRATVGTSATVIVGDSATSIARSTGRIRNQDVSVSVFVGGSAVTTGTGYELKAGLELPFELDGGDQLYGIVTSGSVRVDVIEYGD